MQFCQYTIQGNMTCLDGMEQREHFSDSTNSFDAVYDFQQIPILSKSPLKHVMEDVRLQPKNHDELWLEFGVFSGNTINYISTFAHRVYGFDSFEGLPEKWRDGYGQGAFNRAGVLPVVNANVELVKGWFSDTLPRFLAEQKETSKVTFMHMDADLYSSTKFVFDTVKDRLADSCIIVFDELLNYPGYEQGEYRALQEFLRENPEFRFRWIGMEFGGQPVAIELVRLQR